MKRKGTEIFLLKNTPEDVLATHALAQDSIQAINAALKPAETKLPRYTIWISQEEDLHDFIYQIPDLAWEMLEYAEEPLEILYPRRKYFTSLEEAPQDHISIRLVKASKLVNFVRKNGPLVCFRIEDYAHTKIAHKVLELNNTEQPYRRVKSMKLFEDASFTFVR